MTTPIEVSVIEGNATAAPNPTQVATHVNEYGLEISEFQTTPNAPDGSAGNAPVDNTPTVDNAQSSQPPAVVDDTPTPPVTVEDEPADEVLRPVNPIKLGRPIRINGQDRKEFKWSENITVDQFMEADNLSHKGRSPFNVAELDNGLNFYLGVMMICAANPEVDPIDLNQISGFDIIKVLRLGRFLTNNSGD